MCRIQKQVPQQYARPFYEHRKNCSTEASMLDMQGLPWIFIYYTFRQWGNMEQREAVLEGLIKRQKFPASSGGLFVSVIKEEQSIFSEESVMPVTHSVWHFPSSSPTVVLQNITLFAESNFNEIWNIHVFLSITRSSAIKMNKNALLCLKSMPSFAENCPISKMKQNCSLDVALYSYLATRWRTQRHQIHGSNKAHWWAVKLKQEQHNQWWLGRQKAHSSNS